MEERRINSSSSNNVATERPRVFGNTEFEPDEREAIRHLLHQKLGKDHLANRAGPGGTQLTYMESWRAIDIANGIFGFDGWASSVADITPDFVRLASFFFFFFFFLVSEGVSMLTGLFGLPFFQFR
jgi:hypothetical protein